MVKHKTRFRLSSTESLLRKAHSKTPAVARYCLEVLSGKIPAGKLVFLAIERHVRDLRDATKRGLRYDDDAAIRPIEFFERFLCLAEGENDGKPFILTGFQQFIIASLFGWKGDDGFRRFRSAYVELGKGNGKSPLAAGIGLYGLLADGENAAEIYSAAVVKDQAKVLFRDAENMVKASPALQARIDAHVNNLSVLTTSSFFRPVSSEHRGLDGKRPHMALIDEVHEHPTGIVVQKMRAGTKGRRQALIFMITNSGYDRNTECFHQHEYSRKVLERLIPEQSTDSHFAFIAHLDICATCEAAGKSVPSCPECDQWTDEEVWIKPNPNLGVSIPRKYLREQVDEALAMPSKQNIVQRLNFCIWNEQHTRWIPMDKWDACAAQYTAESLRGHRCYGGFDLASTIDLAAFLLDFPDDSGKVLAFFWIPADNIRKRVERDRVPYDLWVEHGFIKATEGNVIDYDVIRDDIKKLGEKFNIEEIGYDPYNATQISTQLTNDGFLMVPMRQGMETMSPPSKELERRIIGGEIQHDHNPVLRWNMSNMVIRTDHNGNIKPDKEASTEKIDGGVALIMSIGRSMVHDGGGSVYDSRGIMVF